MSRGGRPPDLVGAGRRPPDQPDDLVAVAAEQVAQPAAEEAGRAGHQDPHAPIFADIRAGGCGTGVPWALPPGGRARSRALSPSLAQRECRWATVIFARADHARRRQPGDDRARPRAAPARRGSRRPAARRSRSSPASRASARPGSSRSCWPPSPPTTVVLVGQAEPGSLARPVRGAAGRPRRPRRRRPRAARRRSADPARSPVERLHTGAAPSSTDLVGDRPAVLVFEDLHWADSESAALFERIADQRGPAAARSAPTGRTRSPAAHPVAGAARPGSERRHAVTHVGLERFGEADTAALLAAVTGRPGAVPGGGRAAPAHRRQPVLPRGAAARARGRRPRGARTSSRCRGASPRCCAARSTTSSPSSAADRRGGRRARPPGATSTCSPRSPAPSEDELITRAARPGRPAACWSSPARTSSASGTPWSARRSPASCSAGSAAGCTRPRSTRCSPTRPAAADPAMVAHHAQAAGRYDDMVAAARAGRRALPVDRLGLPGAAAGRDGPGRGRRRPRAARRRGPGGLAGRPARRRRRLRPPLARPGRAPRPTAPTRSTC